MKVQQLSAKEKVAALLLSFGQEVAAEILRHLPRDEVVVIAQTMQRLGRLDPELVDELVSEFYAILQQQGQPPLEGGREPTAQLLQKAFPHGQAADLVQEVYRAEPRMEAVDLVDGATLASLLQKEHPQTIALVLAFCEPRKCGDTLRSLPSELHAEVMQRLANLEAVNPDLLAEVDETLKNQIKQRSHPLRLKKGGIPSLVAMLNRMDKESAQKMLAELTEQDPQLATALRDQMFTFEDLGKLSEASLQTLLKHVSPEVWKLALKGGSPELQAKICGSMSTRAAQILAEDLAAMPKVRRVEVEAAQRRILEQVRALVAQGLLVLDDEETV